MRLQDRYLIELGLRPWVLRGSSPAAPVSASSAATQEPASASAQRRSPAVGPGIDPGQMSPRWDALAGEVSGCTRCALHQGRTRTVFGVGRRDADLLVIGEAPGAEEDRQGEPFVGRAGQLLNAMLLAIGLPRDDVYIANILKCRPPGNRDPQADEIATCTPYLQEQIALIRPRAIFAIGRIAAQWLLQSDAPVGRLRGQVFRYGDAGIPLVVGYHPAYLLRTPLAKARAWDDLKLVRRLLGQDLAGRRPS